MRSPEDSGFPDSFASESGSTMNWRGMQPKILRKESGIEFACQKASAALRFVAAAESRAGRRAFR